MPDMPPLPESQIEKLQAMAAAAKEDGASEPRALPIDWSTEPAPVAANGVPVRDDLTLRGIEPAETCCFMHVQPPPW